MSKLLSTVLHHHFLIQRSGQRVSFQINIPPDARRIVGLETGIRVRYCRSLMPWGRDFTGGHLLLQAGGAGTCYDSHLKVEHNTVIKPDLGYREWRAGFPLWSWLLADAATHIAHREPEPIDIPAPRTIYGSYTDQWGVDEARNITYRVSIFLWVSVNDQYNTPAACTAP